MADIVERLRDEFSVWTESNLMSEAADEIERLRAAVQVAILVEDIYLQRMKATTDKPPPVFSGTPNKTPPVLSGTDDIMTRLSGLHHPYAADAADEIERLTTSRDGWQATAAGLIEDIGNAEDEIERLRDELADWQRTVKAHEEENERLRRENKRAHLGLLVAHSELLGLYDEKPNSGVSDQMRTFAEDFNILSDAELQTLFDIVLALRERSKSWAEGCDDDSALDVAAVNALDAVIQRLKK